MPHVNSDRVKETTATTGTGALTLAGAVTGFEAFSAALANADTCYYGVAGGAEWETGLGTYNAGVLTRTAVYASSNADAAVNFSAGTKDVWITLPARRMFDPYWIKQSADYTLSNVGTEQKLFNESTNGAITLPTGTYHFEAMIFVDVMSATSGNAAFDPLGAGTAVCDRWMWDNVGIDNNNAMNTVATPTAVGVNSQQTPTNAVTAVTGTAMRVKMEGTFRISTAGTMIPSLTLVTAIATAVVKTGSYFMFERIGESGQTSFGPWS